MSKVSTDLLTLEDFLRLPEYKPALEYIGGRVIQKMSPMYPHSVIQTELVTALNSFARPRRLGRAVTELRGVFGGESHVPDISFFVHDRIPKSKRREDPSNTLIPADIAVEIMSRGQTLADLKLKLRHSLNRGSKLGWLIVIKREVIHVLRKGRKAEILRVGDVLSGEDVIPGFSLPLSELFGWLDED